ncbi:thioredoxin domain-containing protein [Pseudarthrobacter equi]|uniref:DsbA family protein n=1 Tax=Pseudarthrobacter equi TaxID=728066 RepID=UPI0021BE4707|nr:DsbA family protein [Pseudarthrobacter equi]MCT9624797.1 thioredoxin domain-containing protein [Pseudarthrobacter equi]
MTPAQTPTARTETPSHPDNPDKASRIRRIIWILMAVIVAAGVAGYAIFTATRPAPAPTPAATDAQLVREDSHRVTTPTVEKAQLVEFLDFECESCRAAEPLVQELKTEYGDRITFIHRYFPLPGHRNSGTAALAVEAAAQQGKYEQMSLKLFETQPQWGEQQESQAELFRTYAQEFGLDMAAYDAAVANEVSKDRIRQDVADGKALGVTGTPTFFLNGEKLVLNSEDQFRQLLEAATK